MINKKRKKYKSNPTTVIVLEKNSYQFVCITKQPQNVWLERFHVVVVEQKRQRNVQKKIYLLFHSAAALQKPDNFKTLVQWNEKKGFSCRQVGCRRTNVFWISLPGWIQLSNCWPGVVGETLGCFWSVTKSVTKEKAKPYKFLPQNFFLRRAQEKSI